MRNHLSDPKQPHEQMVLTSHHPSMEWVRPSFLPLRRRCNALILDLTFQVQCDLTSAALFREYSHIEGR